MSKIIISAPPTYFTKVFGFDLQSNILIYCEGESVTIPPAFELFNVPRNLCGDSFPCELIVI